MKKLLKILMLIVTFISGCTINSTYVDPTKDVLWHPDNPPVTFWNPDNRKRTSFKRVLVVTEEEYEIITFLLIEKMNREQGLIDGRK